MNKSDSKTQSPHLLANDIGAVQAELSSIVFELNRRRRELMDVKLQVRRHPVATGISGFAIVGGLAALITVGIIRRRRHALRMDRAHRLRLAAGRVWQNPDKLAARPPNIGLKILTSLVTAVLVTAAKRGVRRVIPDRPRYALPQSSARV
jgi:hypothetical protein